jgi:phage/plasmid-like protein (TIGR03299 family)
MSHEIEIHADGSAAFISAREDAWHRLGTVVPSEFTAQEALQVAKLGDWKVEKLPVYTRVLTSTGYVEVALPDTYTTGRFNPVTGDQEVIGVQTGNHGTVGKVYDPFQNEQLCDFIDALVDESGAHLQTAGSLRSGADIFVTAKLPEDLLIGGVDPINLNIAVLNNHTGNAAIRALITPTRIVCANTQAAALRNAKATFKIRHTSTAAGRVEEARQALGLTWKYVDQFQTEAEKLIEKSITDAKFNEIVGQLWTPVDADTTGRALTLQTTRNDDLNRLFSDAETNANIRGTAWAGYQAITEYLDHFTPVRGRGVDKDLARAERAATGAYDDVKSKAFSLFAAV